MINLEYDLDKSFQEIYYRVDNRINEGSVESVDGEYVNISIYSPLSGIIYILIVDKVDRVSEINRVSRINRINRVNWIKSSQQKMYCMCLFLGIISVELIGSIGLIESNQQKETIICAFL